MTPISTDIGRSDEDRSTWLIRARETVGRRFNKGHSAPHSAQFGGVSNRLNTLARDRVRKGSRQGFDLAWSSGRKDLQSASFWGHRIPV